MRIKIHLKNNMRKFFILAAILIVYLGIVSFSARGKSLSDVEYPIKELGSCEDKNACEAYCDKAENMEKCVNFAESNELLKEEDIKMARKMLEAGDKGGPGGCKGKTECEAYCDDMGHLEECLSFAEQNGIMAKNEIEDGRKVLQAVKKGIKPPKCKSKKSCDAYCSNPEHMEECITFGEAAGMIPENELEGARKMLNAIKKGVKPLPCGGKEACDVYCGSHFEECINFSEAAGFMTGEEAAMARKTGGKGPGGCKKDECKTFCDNPDNMEECIKFSLENGLMSGEEAEKAKKMLEKGRFTGPGGCKSKEECDAYCSSSQEHMMECMGISVKEGRMSEEEFQEQIRRMNEPRMEERPFEGNMNGQPPMRDYQNQMENHRENMDYPQQHQQRSPEFIPQGQGSGNNIDSMPNLGEFQRPVEEHPMIMPPQVSPSPEQEHPYPSEQNQSFPEPSVPVPAPILEPQQPVPAPAPIESAPPVLDAQSFLNINSKNIFSSLMEVFQF